MNNSKSIQVFLFAAGLGTRLKPFTLITPKPAIPLLGYSLGYYLIPYLKELTISKFFVNTFHLPDQVINLYSRLPFEVHFSHELDFIKGSAGGLKQIEKDLNLNDPLLLANSDEVLFTNNPQFLLKALNEHVTQNHYATLIVIKHPEAGEQFGGIWVDHQNRVHHIGKKKDLLMKGIQLDHLKPFHFIGLQIINPKIALEIQSDQELNIFYDALIFKLHTEKIIIYEIECDWFETGNLEDYKSAKQTILQKIKSKDMKYIEHFEKMKLLPPAEQSDLV